MPPLTDPTEGANPRITLSQSYFLSVLARHEGFVEFDILGGLTDTERRDRQSVRIAGLAECRGKQWRITEAGRLALAKAGERPAPTRRAEPDGGDRE